MKKLNVLFSVILCSCAISMNVFADVQITPKETEKRKAVSEAIGFTSFSNPEYKARVEAVKAYIAGIVETFDNDALPVLYKALEEKIENRRFASPNTGQ